MICYRKNSDMKYGMCTPYRCNSHLDCPIWMQCKQNKIGETETTTETTTDLIPSIFYDLFNTDTTTGHSTCQYEPCSEDNPCKPGLHCVNGMCYLPKCSNNYHCPPGSECENG